MTAAGPALFRQTLLVLAGALILSHLAGFFAVVLLPPTDSRATRFSGIARQLADSACERLLPGLEQTPRLEVSRNNGAPEVPGKLSSDALFDSQLARVLGVPESSVRFAWAQGSDIRLGRPVDLKVNERKGRLEETVFLGELLFARQWPDYWCVYSISPPPLFNHWKVRITLVLLISLAALLPLAWWFARRLSRPIHDFARAADAIGRDEQAPLLEEQGPEEMRIAARALNAMQARIQEQLRERGAMIAAIAHDLRTPLSRIAFRVEAASPQISDSVQRDVEQMNAMITATLEFAKEGQDASGDQIIDLNHLLQSMVQDEQGMGHNVGITPNARPVPVLGNDVQLNRLFQNLIDNARYFGGSAQVSLSERDGSAVVVIADRGPGINTAQIEEMFRPFTRGEPSRNRKTGGMGLGLSITRAIARRHGGEIHLSNRTGGGLLVTVALPVVS